MGPSLAVDGPADRVVFEAYLEEALLAGLRAGQVVVMDNLSAHKGERIRQLIEERGCELLYLPPYSPDLNPIEEAFSKIKGILRKSEARTRDVLWWRRWAGHSLRSALRMPRGSWNTVATVHGFNSYEYRCSGSLLK